MQFIILYKLIKIYNYNNYTKQGKKATTKKHAFIHARYVQIKLSKYNNKIKTPFTVFWSYLPEGVPAAVPGLPQTTRLQEHHTSSVSGAAVSACHEPLPARQGFW